jgi:hypothetical protein
MLKSKWMVGLFAAATMAIFTVTPAWATSVNWNHSFELQTAGGIVNPGVLVGFNPQPDPPVRIAEFGCPAPVNGLSTDIPPGPCLVLHNQHFEAPPFPTFQLFMTMDLPSTHLIFVPDAIPTDNFSHFHVEVDGIPAVIGDINPIPSKLFDVIFDFATSSGGIVDAASAVSFNPQPDPPGDFTPNDWGMSFAYTGNSDAFVTLHIFDAVGTQLVLTPTPEPVTLSLIAAGLLSLGLVRRRIQ